MQVSIHIYHLTFFFSALQAKSLKQVHQELNGKQKCPYSPRQNSTAIITKDGNLYTGTVMDIQARDHAISRVMGPLPILRTLRSNSKWLNGRCLVITSFVEIIYQINNVNSFLHSLAASFFQSQFFWWGRVLSEH